MFEREYNFTFAREHMWMHIAIEPDSVPGHRSSSWTCCSSHSLRSPVLY